MSIKCANVVRLSYNSCETCSKASGLRAKKRGRKKPRYAALIADASSPGHFGV